MRLRWNTPFAHHCCGVDEVEVEISNGACDEETESGSGACDGVEISNDDDAEKEIGIGHAEKASESAYGEVWAASLVGLVFR